jgi:hypothetical protein
MSRCTANDHSRFAIGPRNSTFAAWNINTYRDSTINGGNGNGFHFITNATTRRPSVQPVARSSPALIVAMRPYR